ncbi:MAG: ABC transporter permease [Fusicatenibacter sp.]|nr:ABC transporter permease [Fusicatenibacter sp.]
MRKYLSFFRLRFSMGLQYRAAAAAGIVTQFAWGGMEILVYRAFYRADAAAFPMTMQQVSAYIWLQQAFLALFMSWMMENEIFDGIRNGNVVYELCRPVDLYAMWFSRSMANRLSKAVLRCFPILLIAAILPDPYGMGLPVSVSAAGLFLVGMTLGLIVTVAFCMLVYGFTFFTISPDGLRIFCVSAVELLAGEILPLPFFPDGLRRIVELLPFASMQNVPLRIYSGNISGTEAIRAVGLQAFWAAALILAGRAVLNKACSRMTIQGG